MVVEPVYIYLAFIFLSLAAYAVFGGADFGAGVWELNTRFRASKEEKQLVYRALGPVWEANHVWLIFVMVLFWTGFPWAFARACNLLFVPLFLALAGIVFRGAAYAFRSAMKEDDWQRNVWERVFGIASTAAPFFMGTAIGIWSEFAKEDYWTVPGPVFGDQPDSVTRNPWLTWATPHSLFLGFFAVGLCAFLASVFLYREAVVSKEIKLITVWRRRALTMSIVVGGFSLAGLFVVQVFLPGLWLGICNVGWLLVALSIGCGIGSTFSLWQKYPGTAVITSAMAVAFVILAWGVSMRPYMNPLSVKFGVGAVDDSTLWILIGCVSVGLIIVAPPLIWLMRIFKASESTKD